MHLVNDRNCIASCTMYKIYGVCTIVIIIQTSCNFTIAAVELLQL